MIGCATSGFTSHYEEIMEGTYKKDLFAGTLAEGLVKLLGEIACKCVFKTETIYRMEVKEAVMLDNLLDRFVGAAIKYDDPTQKLNSIEERLISFISNNYKKHIVIMQKKIRSLSSLSETSAGYGLYLWYDRQLCEEAVSGIECDYGIKENISE